ncbi:hypothetical protein QFZ53_000994 [Microbacterium natoriense]|uniref:Uncharacterized protein n=2 Tax=Microbacterium natoriense TaxID=284570 RepID=A0AAW8ETI9_9MICO|nr:hypothetical protein [Microbacterium natoriense]
MGDGRELPLARLDAMRAATSSSLLVVLGASLILSGCASGGNAGFCGPLHDDSEMAAVVFTPMIPEMNNGDEAEERLELAEKLEPTAELADDLETWRTYLEAVVDTIDDDPAAALAAYNDDAAVAKAGTALSDYYGDVCLM